MLDEREHEPEQHDDHIWLTCKGEAWAIRKLDGGVFYLWRGFAPNLEYSEIWWPQHHWEKYAERAAEYIKHYGPRYY